MSTKATPEGVTLDRQSSSPDVSADELLDLFGDEYTRSILEVIADEPKCGQAIADETAFSRATVYRRLNTLVDAGLVTSELDVSRDGNHRNRYQAALDSVSVTLGDGSIEAAVDHAE